MTDKIEPFATGGIVKGPMLTKLGDISEVVISNAPKSKKKVAARTERYPFTKPDGEVVTIEHDLETGQTKIVGKAA